MYEQARWSMGTGPVGADIAGKDPCSWKNTFARLPSAPAITVSRVAGFPPLALSHMGSERSLIAGFSGGVPIRRTCPLMIPGSAFQIARAMYHRTSPRKYNGPSRRVDDSESLARSCGGDLVRRQWNTRAE